MTYTRKFSQFVGQPLDEKVGLGQGANSITPDSGSGSGDIIVIIPQDTSQLAVGRWVRRDQATNLYVHGIATSAEEAEIYGVVREIIDANSFKLQQSGYIPSGTPGFGGFTDGVVYFLSDTVLGMQTDTPPSMNGYINKPLFEADGPDSGWVICLSRGAVIGSPGPIPASSGGGNDSNIVDHEQPGNTFNIGDWIRVGSDNIYVLASGSSFNNAQGVGVVIQNGNPIFRIQFSGFNSNTVTSAVNSVGAPIPITAATAYYLSDLPGQEGKITPTPPTNPLSASKPCFISLSAINGTGWVLPQRPLPMYIADDPNIKLINQPAHGFLSNGLVVKPQTGALNVGKYQLAQANTYNSSYGVGMIRIIDADNFLIQEVGYFSGFLTTPPVVGGVPNPSGALTNGVPYFLSSATAGLITSTEPGAPNFSKPMFMPDQTDAGWILPMRPIGQSNPPPPIEDEIDFANCLGQSTIVLPAGVWTDIPCMEVTVTSNSITSKMLIDSVMNGDRLTISNVYYRLVRNGTPVGVGSGGGTICYGRFFTITFCLSYLFVDVPGIAGSVTYKIQAMSPGGNTVYLNTDSPTAFSGASTIVVEEFL